MNVQRKCGICGNMTFGVLKKYSSFLGMDVQRSAVIKCTDCGIITRYPSLFEGADIKKLAPANLSYTHEFAGGSTVVSSPRYAARLTMVAAQVNGRQLLDIGCGSGAFLKLAKDMGWQVTGTEFTLAAVQKLNEEGITCLLGSLDNEELKGRQFDFIHINHVFEHVDKPVNILQQAANLLAPGGMILIEVPNELEGLVQVIKRWLGFSGASATSFFEHEWFFSATTLATTISKAGLLPVKVFTPAAKVTTTNVILQLLYKTGSVAGRGVNIEAHIRKK
jgi:2-polyprenyl-3-methyl-5-hydroxy-6-metoxy-1,4-benzoquinol methylase